MKPSDLHSALRQATQQTHERLHHHPGLAAVAAGTISRDEYRRLLARLWGFHEAFERQIKTAADAGLVEPDFVDRQRAPLILQDLQTLGLGAGEMDRLPVFESLHRPATRAGFLGSLYVVEGSTLGGTVLARALAPVTGEGPDAARRFFLGYGDANGRRWRELLGRLEAVSGDKTAETQAVDSATATFADFERWMTTSG